MHSQNDTFSTPRFLILTHFMVSVIHFQCESIKFGHPKSVLIRKLYSETPESTSIFQEFICFNIEIVTFQKHDPTSFRKTIVNIRYILG